MEILIYLCDTYLCDALELFLGYFNSPNKRIYYVYIFTSTILAITVYYRRKHKVSIRKYLFNKKTWLSSSAYTDYSFILFNSLIKVLFIAPFLIFSLKIAFYTNEYLIDCMGYYKGEVSKRSIIIIYTITIFIIGDFTTFLLHYIHHKIPFLWRFHAIHHSATVLNPITQYRIHPIELMLNNAKGIIVAGFFMGIFEYYGSGRVSSMTFNGVNILNFLFLFLGANLRHSNVKLKYPSWLEHILISPVQHQVHHSNAEEHWDKNMGSRLAIWDWIFGTLILSNSVKKLQYGLGKEQDEKYKTFWNNLVQPFKW